MDYYRRMQNEDNEFNEENNYEKQVEKIQELEPLVLNELNSIPHLSIIRPQTHQRWISKSNSSNNFQRQSYV